MEFGNEHGETCNRRGCEGVIEEIDNREGGCSCHMGHPPCGYCTTNLDLYCSECGWELPGDEVIHPTEPDLQYDRNLFISQLLDDF